MKQYDRVIRNQWIFRDLWDHVLVGCMVDMYKPCLPIACINVLNFFTFHQMVLV